MPPSSFTIKHPVSSEYCAIAPPSFPLNRPRLWTRDIARSIPHRRQVTVDMLPGETLLEIFDWHLIDSYSDGFIDDSGTWDEEVVEAWQTLVHVCQKWRNIVFGSPHLLNLQLVCTGKKPVRKMLDLWPPLPIVISNVRKTMSEDNIVAALTHNVRVRGIVLWEVPSSLWEKVLGAMQEPFPALTRLGLYTTDESTVSDSFLGGSAPNLQYLKLSRVPFPGLPKLLSSATHLCTLHIHKIPHSGYFSPEAMATALSVLTRLEEFLLEFESPRSCPGRGRRRPPPPTRPLLPALTRFDFKGVSEYLEDLVSRIDAPLLDRFEIQFYPQLIFHTPQLAQFIGRTPNLPARDEGHLIFSHFRANFALPRYDEGLDLKIFCRQLDWQLSMLAQVCSSSLPLILSLEHLYIRESMYVPPSWPDDIENVQWLELLRPFTTVKALYLSQGITPQVAPALQELVGERATEVLPALQSLFLENLPLSGPVQKAVDTIVAARQLSGHPIAISRWDK